MAVAKNKLAKLGFVALSPLFFAACATNPGIDPQAQGRAAEAYLNEHPESCYRILFSEEEQVFEHNADCENAKQITELMKGAFRSQNAKAMQQMWYYMMLKDRDFYNSVQNNLREDDVLAANQTLSEAVIRLIQPECAVTEIHEQTNGVKAFVLGNCLNAQPR